MFPRKIESCEKEEITHHIATELMECKVLKLVENMDNGNFNPNNPIHARMMENIRVITHGNAIQEELQHMDKNSH